MTNKARVKECLNCGCEFTEKKGDSNKQWELRVYCSIKCRNSSKERVSSIYDRLDKFQVKACGCWSWSGSKDNYGYGILSSRKGGGFSPEKAHRVSYEKFNGEIPEGMCIRHKCDNPECTNPKHLEVGTQKENMQDCSKRGRLNPKSLVNLISGAKGYCGAAIEKNKVK